MKTKIKSLLFLLPTLSITSLATALTTVSCGKKHNDDVVTVSGTVTDNKGDILKDVNVSCNGNVVKTDKNGKYTISYTKTTDVIYFEKYGYIAEVRTNLDPSQNWDVQLTNYYDGETKTISVTVTDKLNTKLAYTCVTFFPDSDMYKKVVYTDDEGKINPFNIVVPSHTDYAIPYQIEHKGVDYSVRTLQLSGQEEYTIQAVPYQYDIKAFVANDTPSNNIIMHAYREVEDGMSQLRVELTSSFPKAFYTENPYIYKLTFCVTNKASSPKATAETGNYFSITFTANGVMSADHATGITVGNEEKIKIDRQSNYLLDVVIPSDFYDFSNEGAVGIHLASLDEKGTEESKGTFQPFSHNQANTKSTNQLCYIRLGEHNEFFSATDNEEPKDIFNGIQWWDGTDPEPDGFSYAKTVDGDKQQLLIGTVGQKYNFGYQVEFAVSKKEEFNGIYILTEYQHDQMSDFINDGYMPHFFIDTNPYDPETGYPKPGFTQFPGNIKNYSPFGGYWMRQYLVTGEKSAEAETYEYTQFYDSDPDKSPKVYSKNDLIITYIPFGIFDVSDRNISNIGISCNLHYHYTGGEWFGWNGKNPTGYPTDIPHFEDVASYIRFDYNNNNLTIRPYSV